MRSAVLSASLLLSGVFCLAPAIGQEPGPHPGLKLHRLGRRAGRPGACAPCETPSTAPSGPAWTFTFGFTEHTGLYNHSAVYDPATNIMIVFGGIDAGLAEDFTSAVLLRTNANAEGNWITLIGNLADGSPGARASHSAVYDSANNRMIVFGGVNSCNCSELNDVWVLGGANGQAGTPVWTQLSPTGTPPAPRAGHVAVYDAASNRMTVFGGANEQGLLEDVWVLSNANGLGGTPAWTQLSPSGRQPNGVYAATAVYDAAGNIMTVFGGANLADTADTNAVWTLAHANGLGGRPRWTNIVPNATPGSPSKRDSHTAVYDPANNRMIVFGGFNPAQTGFSGLNDVWVLSNANGLGGTPAWTLLTPNGQKPGVRYFHTSVYDAVNNLLIVFSGVNPDAIFYSTWVLSGANGL